eukprot:7115358-Alexandrium_andersonii.AAC.1
METLPTAPGPAIARRIGPSRPLRLLASDGPDVRDVHVVHHYARLGVHIERELLDLELELRAVL